MTSYLETCKKGLTAGSIVGGLAGVGVDIWLSVDYVRPFINHLIHSDEQAEIGVTAVIALFALPFIAGPAALAGKIIGPPTAVAVRGLYDCGSAGVSALRRLSLFCQPTRDENFQDLEAGESAPLLPKEQRLK